MAGTYRYRIEARDIDSTLRVRICALGDLILLAAGDDADMLGFGIEDLNSGSGQASRDISASWVLSRMAIEMRRMPGRHENVSVYTWVSDYGRLMTTRNMAVTDESGAETGAAVTQWAMIDLATRRPLDLSALSNKNTSLVDRDPPIERPRRLRDQDAVAGCGPQPQKTCPQANGADCPDEVGGRWHRSHRVVYSDIDFNGHVNSMKYIEWMLDLLPMDAIASTAGGFRLDINYLHEALLGEELTILCASEAASGDSGSDLAGTAICPGNDTDICLDGGFESDGGGTGPRNCPQTCNFDIRNSAGTSVCRASLSFR